MMSKRWNMFAKPRKYHEIVIFDMICQIYNSIWSFFYSDFNENGENFLLWVVAHIIKIMVV